MGAPGTAQRDGANSIFLADRAEVDLGSVAVCNPHSMPLVTFAPALTRHVPCPRQDVRAETLRAALDAAFEAAPAMRGYVLDEQGAVRKHVAVFVNGEMIASRSELGQALAPGDQVMVIQALTGG